MNYLCDSVILQGDNKKNYQVDGTDTEVDIDDEVTLPTLTRQQPTSKRKGKARSRKGNGPCMELRDEENPASPNTRRKRSASTAGFPAVLHSPKSPPTRRSMSLSEQPPTLLPEVAFNTQSFTQYRQSSAKIGSGKLCDDCEMRGGGHVRKGMMFNCLTNYNVISNCFCYTGRFINIQQKYAYTNTVIYIGIEKKERKQQL